MHLKFELFSDEELIKNSILISNKNELIDNTTSYTLDPNLPCKQCKKVIECSGHLGRIPLYQYIVHPLFVKTLCKELTHICPLCKKYKSSNKLRSICCNKRINSTTFNTQKFGIEEDKDLNKKSKSKYKSKFKFKTKYRLENVFSFGNEYISINKMYEFIQIADFTENPMIQQKLLNAFIKNIPVLPINMRPSLLNSNNVKIHNNITSLYFNVLDLNQEYQYNVKSSSNSTYALDIYNTYKTILGIHGVGSTEDSDKTCIKQILSGKSGIFRSMCLAKRQNFCLRSVIVPNIDIPLDKILIPKEFTDQLIPYGYKLNDYVIINRQPTLQTTSLLAVHSYPSQSLTIQINPLIANVFQADFDGDEMNVFWLPGEEAKKEMATKLNIANNIHSYKNASLMIKFIQDTLTGLYNMTKDKNIIEPFLIQRICKKLGISNHQWNNFRKFYKSRMNTEDIPYAHLLSLLLPRTLTLKYQNNLMVDRGILMDVVHGGNQMALLNSIIHYGNDFYLKFMWDVQRMVHEYNLCHTITISVADCIPDKNLETSFNTILNKIPKEMYSIPLANLDSSIFIQNKLTEQSEDKINVLDNYHSLIQLIDDIHNNLTNIVYSGSKGSKDNITQILMSVGVQSVLPNCYIKSSYSEGLSAKELFIHSKSGRAGIISTSLNTSSTGYLQRELVKCMEDLVTDENGIVHDYSHHEICHYPLLTNTQDIDDNFLEYAFSMSCI